MAYEDPLAARYERVNMSCNGYQKIALKKAAKKYKKAPSTLAYLWIWEPENPIAIESREYAFSMSQQLESQDIYECA